MTGSSSFSARKRSCLRRFPFRSTSNAPWRRGKSTTGGGRSLGSLKPTERTARHAGPNPPRIGVGVHGTATDAFTFARPSRAPRRRTDRTARRLSPIAGRTQALHPTCNVRRRREIGSCRAKERERSGSRSAARRFTVTGRVLTEPGGTGVAGATVGLWIPTGRARPGGTP